MRVGDLDVMPVRDGAARMPPSEAYRMGTDEVRGQGGDAADWAAHRSFLEPDGMLELRLGGFLVPAARLVLIDTRLGDIQRGAFEAGRLLAAAGQRRWIVDRAP